MVLIQIRPPIPFHFNIHKALKDLQERATRSSWIRLRFVDEITHERSCRSGKVQTNQVTYDRGIMVESFWNGHLGYAGTSDLSPSGIFAAYQRSQQLAQLCAPACLTKFDLQKIRPVSQGHYRSPAFQDLSTETLSELVETLRLCTEKLKVSEEIISTLAATRLVETTIHTLSTDGSDVCQEFLLTSGNFQATAKRNSLTQIRTANGSVARCLQFGLESLQRDELFPLCEKVGTEALDLLSAPPCPSGKRDLLLAPDQMLLQIHESIGHPLEIDRILGDERNYAGWSFVQPHDFGNLQYGSPLLNVTFDPSVPGEYASYSFDEVDMPAHRKHLIQNGVLVRGLGGAESQFRSHIPGVANMRAASWNRAPLDRMANINLEPGTTSLQKMIESTENGILMEANQSWSIDDYRNKFQFGCEYARLIQDGRLTQVVRNPNYRGITVPFWNSLKAVGTAEETEIYGSPWCGKGEPSQVIRVGHASPPCLFSNIEVFGGLT